MGPKVLPLAHEYSSELLRCDEGRWREIINGFDDANLYQTWPYDAIQRGEANLLHCVVSKSGRIVGVAQARLRLLPALPVGAAYVRWGPLWRRRDSAADLTDFRMVLRALRNELVLKRGLFLRVYPLGFSDESSEYRVILEEEGFSGTPEEVPQRTLLLNLEPSLEAIRKNFDHKWRNCLSKAERNDLECVDGFNDELFSAFIELYRALLTRKQFKEPNDINQFRRVQRRLPNDQKMRIFLTGKGGSPSCGAICTALGTTGVYLFGACNDQGLTTNGSYLIQWNIIQWLKQQGCRQYNLNGINPELNPGTYHFKSGVAGRVRRETKYIGRFDTYAGSMTATGIHALNKALLGYKSLLGRVARSI